MSLRQPSLFETFAARSDEHPQRAALSFEGLDISYAQLRAMAEAAASWIHGLTGRSAEDLHGQRAVLQLPKAPLTYALWLACLRLGITYTFADPKNPELRMAQIVSRLKPCIVFSQMGTPNPFGKSVTIDTLSNVPAFQPSASMRLPASPSHALQPTYVMFTSGSTGEPKGAVIPAMGVMNLVAWAAESVVPLVAKDPSSTEVIRFSNINPLHFDNSVFDIYCSLLNGHTLVPVETADMPNPGAWLRRLNEGGAQIIFGVPTLFQTFTQLKLLKTANLPRARLFMFGGEGFPVPALRRFMQDFKDQAVLLNVYGPTETSCICSSVVIDETSLAGLEQGFPSIGRMHAGYAHAVIGEDGGRCAVNLPGELWIGGDNVGLGYFNNPELTRQAFRQNPLQSDYREIWYKTGDLVREGDDGYLWFAGRADNQVKVRGYRIELEEIDAAIEKFPGIERANATVLKLGDNDILAAAFSASSAIDTNMLIAHCRSVLPHYMVPAKLQQLEKLPKNANGKVDRKAIKAMFHDALAKS